MDGMVINTCGEDYGVQECKVLKNGVQKHGIQKNGIQKHEFQQNGVKRDGVKVNGADHIGVKYLCLTTYSYRRPGMTDEDYHAYISNFHVPLSSDIMAKFGVVKRLVTHNHGVSAKDATIVADPFPLDQLLDYDIVVTTVISDVAKFQAMKDEPFWKEKIIPDWANFADTPRTRVTVGWIEERIRDGVVLY